MVYNHKAFSSFAETGHLFFIFRKRRMLRMVLKWEVGQTEAAIQQIA